MKNPQVPPNPYESQRSPEWPRVRTAHLAEQPTCQACAGTEVLVVHHMKAFHLFPELLLDEYNLITLCEKSGHDCHFIFGHLHDWTLYNHNVIADVANYLREQEQAQTPQQETAQPQTTQEASQL